MEKVPDVKSILAIIFRAEIENKTGAGTHRASINRWRSWHE
jgi:hypothetical protein